MARMSAALLDAHFGGGEVEFVVKDGHIFGCHFVKAHGLADGLTREVHKGRRLQEQHFFAAEIARADLPLKLRLPRGEPMIARDFVQHHKADVVTVLFIFRARISETYKKLHQVFL